MQCNFSSVRLIDNFSRKYLGVHLIESVLVIEKLQLFVFVVYESKEIIKFSAFSTLKITKWKKKGFRQYVSLINNV